MTLPPPPPPPSSGPLGSASLTDPRPLPPPPGGSGAGGRPNLAKAWSAEYKLLTRSICTPGRLAAIGALAGIAVLLAILVRLANPDDILTVGVGFMNGTLATLLPVAVLVFGAGSIGDLIDDGSLVYLWLRPIPSHIHVTAAWAATCTVTIPLVLLPMVAGTMIIHPSGDVLSASIIGGLVGVAAYSALFVTLGVRVRRALPWGLVYILIWEGFVASAGSTATKLAIRSYVRSILTSQTGVDLKLAEFTLATGIIVPLVVGALALAYAARRINRADVA